MTAADAVAPARIGAPTFAQPSEVTIGSTMAPATWCSAGPKSAHYTREARSHDREAMSCSICSSEMRTAGDYAAVPSATTGRRVSTTMSRTRPRPTRNTSWSHTSTRVRRTTPRSSRCSRSATRPARSYSRSVAPTACSSRRRRSRTATPRSASSRIRR